MVVVCRQCGHHNEPGSEFCSECHAYLEWEGEVVVDDRPWWQVEDERLAAEQAAKRRRWWPFRRSSSTG